MIASMVFGSMPCAFSATCVDTPQSIRNVFPAASRRKQVLYRPPEPNASPHPTTVSRISGRRARTLADLRMPAPQIGELLRHDQLRGPHEVHRDQGGDVGNRVVVSRNEQPVLQLAVEQPEEF